MASAKRSGLYKIDDFGAFVGFPAFQRFRKPEIQETTRASEMASAKGADSAKSTTFGLLWGVALEMASAKGADSTKSTTLGLL